MIPVIRFGWPPNRQLEEDTLGSLDLINDFVRLLIQMLIIDPLKQKLIEIGLPPAEPDDGEIIWCFDGRLIRAPSAKPVVPRIGPTLSPDGFFTGGFMDVPPRFHMGKSPNDVGEFSPAWTSPSRSGD